MAATNKIFHDNMIATTTSLLDRMTSEVSSTFFTQTPEYPTLPALLARAGIRDLNELKQLPDAEYRELTRTHAQSTLLQHAMAWHERQQLLGKATRHSHQSIKSRNRPSAMTVSPALPRGPYNLETMSRQTDLTVPELTRMSEDDFVHLSKQILQNDTLRHARVFIEYKDAKNQKNTLWFRSCTTNSSSSMMNMPSLEEFCCGAVGGVSTDSNGAFRSQSPPTTTRKWSELF